MNKLSAEASLSKLFWLRSKKGSTLEGKNLLLVGANSFLLECTPFSEGTGVQESKQEVAKVVSLAENGGTSSKCILHS